MKPIPPRARFFYWLLWALAVVLVACSSDPPNPFTRTSPAASELRITVENQSFNDVRVYAETSRGPQPLGVVGGNSNRDFRMDWRQLDEIRFRLEELAGRTYYTNYLTVSPGDRLDMVIPDNLANSFIRRR